jgi:hypothetical protein
VPCRGAENTIWGKVVASPESRAMMSLVSPESFVTCLSTKGVPESEVFNLLVG